MDYFEIVGYLLNYYNIDQFIVVGNVMSIFVNRVFFCFNLIGLSIVVDIVCLLFLIVFKLVVDSLYNEECEVVIVCVFNIVLSYVK